MSRTNKLFVKIFIRLTGSISDWTIQIYFMWHYYATTDENSTVIPARADGLVPPGIAVRPDAVRKPYVGVRRPYCSRRGDLFRSI